MKLLQLCNNKKNVLGKGLLLSPGMCLALIHQKQKKKKKIQHPKGTIAHSDKDTEGHAPWTPLVTRTERTKLNHH